MNVVKTAGGEIRGGGDLEKGASILPKGAGEEEPAETVPKLV